MTIRYTLFVLLVAVLVTIIWPYYIVIQFRDLSIIIITYTYLASTDEVDQYGWRKSPQGL